MTGGTVLIKASELCQHLDVMEDLRFLLMMTLAMLLMRQKSSLTHYFLGLGYIPGGCLGFLNHQQYFSALPRVHCINKLVELC